MKQLCMVLLVLCSLQGFAQTDTKKHDDTSSIDGIIAALYDVISGPAGERDWDRLRSLCLPATQFNALMPNREGAIQYHANTVEGYIKLAGPIFKQRGFFESEVHRTVDEYANIAQVFSTYESRFEEKGEPFASGINSFQLMRKDNRWWVVNVLWHNASETYPIPEKYSGK